MADNGQVRTKESSRRGRSVRREEGRMAGEELEIVENKFLLLRVFSNVIKGTIIVCRKVLRQVNEIFLG